MNSRKRRVSLLFNAGGSEDYSESGSSFLLGPWPDPSSSSISSDDQNSDSSRDATPEAKRSQKLPESIPTQPQVIPFTRALLDEASLRRGERWKRYLRPDLLQSRFSENLYEKMLSLASTTKIHNRLIEKDVDRTFPVNKLFTPPHSGMLALSNVLRAYSVYDSETGYSQGIAFLAGFLLLHLGNERETFWCLVAMMYSEKYNMRALYRHSQCLVLKLLLEHFHRLLAQLCPEIHKHLEHVEIVPSMYATQWFCTIFASRFEQQFAGQIWDLFFIDGPVIVFQVGLSILVSLRRRLTVGGLENILPLLANIPIHELPRHVLTRARTLLVSESFIRTLMRIEPEEHASRPRRSISPASGERSEPSVGHANDTIGRVTITHGVTVIPPVLTNDPLVTNETKPDEIIRNGLDKTDTSLSASYLDDRTSR
eukprot:gb/GEZN01006253.1/.p1 GENE.gb/GEZN01006253.1/~~gb/GEZN01006253.1/.p1  ORF type:complete len:426 (+),score=24.82 gb/GEZN01006253.1/:295-1572(+)